MKKVKLYESFLDEANKGKVHKAAKQGSYPAVIVVVEDGKVIHQESVSTPQVAPATFNVMQEKYPKAIIHLEDKTGKRLFSESVTEGTLKISGAAYDLWDEKEVQRKLRDVKIKIIGDIGGVATIKGNDDELQKVKDILGLEGAKESVVNEKLSLSEIKKIIKTKEYKEVARALQDVREVSDIWNMLDPKMFEFTEDEFEDIFYDWWGDQGYDSLREFSTGGSIEDAISLYKHLLPYLVESVVNEGKGAKLYFDDLKYNYQKSLRYLDKDEKKEYNKLAKDFFSKLAESVVTESVFSFKTDNIEQLHFETDPKMAELMKIELGKKQGEVSKRKQIDSADYSLKRFRKSINYGSGKDVGVFLPGSYDASVSRLGDGPHKKAVKAVKWNQKKYDQWLEDMAANGGAENAFDMAQNAKNEPGLIDWVKKNFRGDDPMQRVQWDIEAFA